MSNQLFSLVQTYINDLSMESAVGLYNQYAADQGESSVFMDAEVAVESCFDDPLKAAQAVFFGSIDSWAKPVCLDAYGNLVSWYMDTTESQVVAEWAIENDLVRTSYWVVVGADQYPVFADNEAEAIEELRGDLESLLDEEEIDDRLSQAEFVIEVTGVGDF